jgi:hypothetical protein
MTPLEDPGGSAPPPYWSRPLDLSVTVIAGMRRKRKWVGGTLIEC